jgi:TonB family protein
LTPEEIRAREEARLEAERRRTELERRRAEEARLAPSLKNSIGMELVLVKFGEFQMGDERPENRKGREYFAFPVHRVDIKKPFYMGKYEVTQAQWRAVMGNNPSRFKGDNLPVESVSWNGAKDFCHRLSQMTGEEYRLPTEAEWEYACRAGTTGDYAGDLNAMAWYDENSDSKTHPVGQKQPNAFGLYDMHGNVWEWCEDQMHDSYNGAPTEGRAWVDISAAESSRVIRGGSWYIDRHSCRSAVRRADRPYGRTNGPDGQGFRVAMTAKAKTDAEEAIEREAAKAKAEAEAAAAARAKAEVEEALRTEAKAKAETEARIKRLREQNRIIQVSDDVLQNNAVKKVQPPYPSIANAARVGGSVQVQLLVSEEGNVFDASIITGHPLLRDVVLKAARQWVFKPTEVKGVPVWVEGTLVFNFTLIR